MATESRAMTVNDVIDSRPVSRFQAMTILLCGLVLLLDGFDTQAMGFLVPPIAEELGIPLPAFGPVLSAGLFGLMLGAMGSGPIADRWGRKWAIIVSALVFGSFSLLTPQADTVGELVALRFLTGLGLGGAMPNVVALASEYAPKRLQPILVTLIFVGMGGGAVLASLVGGALIPIWGWRSVFYVGGILPITLALLLIKLLPESVRFLTVRGGDPRRVSAIMQRIAPDLGNTPFAPMPANRHTGVAVTHLFTEGRTAGTLLLWVPFFMNLLILYFILSWLPSLLRQAGMPVTAGITAVLSFSIGGIVGTILQGPLMKGLGVFPAILGEFIASLGAGDPGGADFRELSGDDGGHVRPGRHRAGRAGGHQRAVGDVLPDGDSLDGRRLGARHRPHRLDHRAVHRRPDARGAVDAAADLHGGRCACSVRGGGGTRQREAAGQRQPVPA